MNGLIDKQGTITHSMDEMLKVAERFYTRLYAGKVMPGGTTEPTRLACEVPFTTKEEIGKKMKVIKRAKAAGNDGISVDFLKEGRDIVLKYLR